MCDGKNGFEKTKKQQSLFDDIENEISKEWHDMPEFKHEDKRAYHSLIVNFEDKEGFDKFIKLINKSITKRTRSIFYPESKLDLSSNYLYTDES